MKNLNFLLLYVLLICSCVNKPTQPNQRPDQVHEKKDTIQQAPRIKVYMENSGSMDGYVKGATDFENAVYSYLSDLQLADLGEKFDSTSFKNVLELNYINSQVLKQKSDVQAFIKELEPDAFRIRGGKRGASDMSNILDTIFNHADYSKDVSILISDCIFSPGKQYKTKDNADDYLVSQQIGIKSHIVEQITHFPDFSIVVLRLISQFNGNYYNKYDDKTSINETRPFYIWLMGNRRQLKRILNEVDVAYIKGSGVQNIYMASNPVKSIPYGILPAQSIGKFKPDPNNPKTSIKNAEVDKKAGNSCFQLAIGIDYSQMLLSDAYLTDVSNYEISNKAYSIDIAKNKNPNSSYTHILMLNLNEPIISRGTVKISLKNVLPSWINEYTDNNGLDIHADGAMKKTYGLKFLLGGVYEAYSSEKDNCHSVITVNIK
jgi:hypothetical protein